MRIVTKFNIVPAFGLFGGYMDGELVILLGCLTITFTKW